VLVIKLDDKPALLYVTKDGAHHVDYFLGRNGQLPNVARRAVAVDDSGEEHPLQTTSRSNGTLDVPGTVLTCDGVSGVRLNANVDLARIKAVRLETRPYQIVEFRDVPLRPRRGL
jgi:hypothetical protein